MIKSNVNLLRLATPVGFLGAVLLLQSSAAHGESGFFGCNSNFEDCQLLKDSLAGSESSFEGEPFLTSFLVDYTFSCIPGHYESNIRLTTSGEGGHGATASSISDHIEYESSGSLRLEGYGPINVIDTDPVGTRLEYFAPGCDLQFSLVRKIPANSAIDDWIEETDGLIKSLNLQASIVNFRSLYEVHYQTYLGQQATARTSLESLLTNLLSAPTLAGNAAQIKSIQAILANKSYDEVMKPFQQAKEQLAAYEAQIAPQERKLNFALSTVAADRKIVVERKITELEGAKNAIQ